MIHHTFDSGGHPWSLRTGKKTQRTTRRKAVLVTDIPLLTESFLLRTQYHSCNNNVVGFIRRPSGPSGQSPTPAHRSFLSHYSLEFGGTPSVRRPPRIDPGQLTPATTPLGPPGISPPNQIKPWTKYSCKRNGRDDLSHPRSRCVCLTVFVRSGKRPW